MNVARHQDESARMCGCNKANITDIVFAAVSELALKMGVVSLNKVKVSETLNSSPLR